MRVVMRGCGISEGSDEGCGMSEGGDEHVE